MTDQRQQNLQLGGQTPATILPPAMIEESAWDILIALHSDRRCDLSLAKLACLVSVTPAALNRWLATLEDGRFVTGAKNGSTGELRAVLTQSGRQLLDRYLAASNELRVGKPN